MDPHLSVDARALDAGEDPQVGGKPLRVYKHRDNMKNTCESFACIQLLQQAYSTAGPVKLFGNVSDLSLKPHDSMSTGSR